MNKSGMVKVFGVIFMIACAIGLGTLGYGVANYFTPGNMPVTLGSGILAALFAIFVVRQSMRGRANSAQQGDAGKLSLVKEKLVRKHGFTADQADEVINQARRSQPQSSSTTGQATAARPAPKPLAQKYVNDAGENQVSYTTEKLADGSVKVVITANGLSGRQFKGANGLRDRVNSIKGAKFTAGNNPAKQERTLTATVKPGPQQASVLSALVKLLGQPSSSK